MAVTYRTIERNSKRRFNASAESTVVSSSSRRPVWSPLTSSVSDSKNWAVRQLSLLFGLSLCSWIRFPVQEWIASIICGQYSRWLFSVYKRWIKTPVTLLLAVSGWTVKRVLYCYFGVLAADIRTDQHGSEADANRWSVTVYLIDAPSALSTRRAIADETDARPSLKLLCAAKMFGRLEIWRRWPDADVGCCYSLVRELSPVWQRELVTQDTVHDYVSDVVQRADDAGCAQRPPWRVYLIPLACDPSALDGSGSSCCVVAHCHRMLSDAVDGAIRRALRTRPRLPTDDRHRGLPVRRSIPTGSQHAPAVSWTKAVARADFIDRVCLLTGSTIRELFLAAFCQSLNQCYNQSDVRHDSAVVRIAVDDQEYALPLGTALLEDGQLVLAMLKSQRLAALEKEHRPAGPEPPRHLCPMPDERRVSVRMETAAASDDVAGIDAVFRWPAPCTLSSPIRLGLWTGHSSVRLGVMQGGHPALARCRVRVDEVERRLHQLAAACGVQTGRPLSPHSTPSNSPGCTPPPTPRPQYEPPID